MNTDYNQQAIDFLAKTGTTFKAEFLKHDKHFDDDKETRDIYKITLERGSRKYSFNFGQSLNDSGFYYTKGKQKIELERKLLNLRAGEVIRFIKKHDWDFLNNGKSDKIHWPVVPSEYDVLACITKHDPGTFENFCSEFGYETDSKKAEKTYKAVLDEYKNVAMLYSDDEIEELAEIS